MDKTMKIGFNTFDGDVLEARPSFTLPAESGKGVDFVLCHFDPQRFPLAQATKAAEQAAAILKEKGIDFIANFEFQNFDRVSNYGDYDWANRPDGTHRLNLPKDSFMRF